MVARSVPETTNRMCSALELDVQAYAIAAVVQFHDVGDVSNIVVIIYSVASEELQNIA